MDFAVGGKGKGPGCRGRRSILTVAWSVGSGFKEAAAGELCSVAAQRGTGNQPRNRLQGLGAQASQLRRCSALSVGLSEAGRGQKRNA